MNEFVTQYDRNSAARNAKSILSHLLYQVQDACNRIRDCDSPEFAIGDMSRLLSLMGKVKNATYDWRGFYLDWKSHEPPTEQVVGPNGEVAPIPSGPENPAPGEESVKEAEA